MAGQRIGYGRRVAFNAAVGNRDDHLPNRGFILTAAGGRLAPAFDINPNMVRIRRK